MDDSIQQNQSDRSHETDVVIVGSGIGGLCCGALLGKYGYKVTLCESHYLPGGAAHSFEMDGYKFDAGPSFHAGLTGDGLSANPLKQVLDAVGETVPCATYDRWITYTPEGTFPCVANREAYLSVIRQQGGEEALQQWIKLEREMEPLQRGASLFPAAAMRFDLGVILTLGKFGPQLAFTGLQAPKLTGPFGNIVDRVVTNKWLRNFIDLECFVLSGMTAKDTLCAEMAFMFMERNKPDSTIDYPMGGSEAIVGALVRAIEKFGGKVLLRAHVEEIVVQGGQAVGVRLRSKKQELIKAKHAVVSNASTWDTQKLLPDRIGHESWRYSCRNTPQTESFMHLHLGINADGLDPDLQCHHLIVNDWGLLTAPQNVCIASIPTVFDKSLAPPGKALVHAYTAGNEPYSIWAGMKTNSQEYKELKEERSECLWKALERFIPDIRERTELKLVGTPLTHERFLRRNKGTYGPAISAANGSFPGPKTPIQNLYVCGDSCQPGIGVPAAAASGMICANTMSSVFSQLKVMSELGL